MLAAQTASLLRGAHARPWSALAGFLRRELAPFPGRTAATLRVVAACVTVLILCMTLRVPEAYLSVWLVTRFAMEESSQTVLTAIVFLVALTLGLALPLVLLTFAMDQAWLRFVLMGTMAALGLFLRRTFVIGGLGFVTGLIGTLIMTVPDFVPVPELVVRGSLWLWPVFALGIAAAAAANLLIAPRDPEELLRAELVTRLRAAEDSLANQLAVAPPAPQTRRLATAGVTRMLVLLKSAAVVHTSVKEHQAQYAAVITLVDRLVTAAAALELLSSTVLSTAERERVQRVAARCAVLRGALEDRTEAELPLPRPGVQPPADSGSARLPAIAELEHSVDLLQQALAPQAVASEPPSEAEHRRLFVPDAFTNPEYLHYALKGALAVMLCYVLQSAVAWPGIRTCIVTCMIVGLGSEGATIQKGTLRIVGALVGAAMGFLAVLFLIPGMESITSLTLLVAAGTAVAAWVVAGSPRISYAGVQIAFAFFLCVIQGFAPTWYFYTIRDRLVGILLGNTVITVVFLYVWPVQASSTMWSSLASALRTMAQLARVGRRSADQKIIANAINNLRLQAYRDFTAAQQLADESAFEPSVEADGASRVALAARERLQRATADAQSVFLTQLTLAQQRPNVTAPTVTLPDALIDAVRRFDAVVGASLDAIADRAHGLATGPLPDLRVPLAALNDLITDQRMTTSSPEAAVQMYARLALYRDLVPRIERLGAAELG